MHHATGSTSQFFTEGWETIYSCDNCGDGLCDEEEHVVARIDLSAGDYWVLIEGNRADQNGNYTLTFDCLSYAHGGDEIDEYDIHDITTTHSAYYSVVVNDETILHERMGRTSSLRQSNEFTIAIPTSGRTALSGNAASQGGGGAVFWEEAVPENLERYRSDSNTALYGDYVGTPERMLSATRLSYDAYSGRSMGSDPIIVELKDE